MTPASTSGISAKPRVNFAQLENRSLVPRNSRLAMNSGASDTAMARPTLAIPETRMATQAISAPMIARMIDSRLIEKKPLSSAARSEKSKIDVTISSRAPLSDVVPDTSSSAAPTELGTLVSMS